MSNILTDKTVYDGPPSAPAGRLQKELDTYALLEKLDIPYRRVDHAPAMTIDDCAEVDRLLGIEMCKNLFLRNRQGTEFFLLMLPGDKQFKTKDLSAQLGCARLSFAEGELMEKFLNITPGSLSVLGLAFDTEKNVRLIIDREITAREYVGCHPCVNTSSLRLRSTDLLEKFLPSTGHEATFVSL